MSVELRDKWLPALTWPSLAPAKMKTDGSSLNSIQSSAAVFAAAVVTALWLNSSSGQIENEISSATSAPASGVFVDVTKVSGVGDQIALHYERHPKWWLSGLNLVDLDGDGQVDLFLAAHGAGRSLALLNDGHGHFKEADGSYPPSEIHLADDIDGDGKLDLQMTWQDGGGKWWLWRMAAPNST